MVQRHFVWDLLSENLMSIIESWRIDHLSSTLLMRRNEADSVYIVVTIPAALIHDVVQFKHKYHREDEIHPLPFFHSQAQIQVQSFPSPFLRLVSTIEPTSKLFVASYSLLPL